MVAFWVSCWSCCYMWFHRFRYLQIISLNKILRKIEYIRIECEKRLIPNLSSKQLSFTVKINYACFLLQNPAFLSPSCVFSLYKLHLFCMHWVISSVLLIVFVLICLSCNISAGVFFWRLITMITVACFDLWVIRNNFFWL